jgi:hypothetical protein
MGDHDVAVVRSPRHVEESSTVSHHQNPSHQLHHLTKHMHEKVALSVNTHMKLRSMSTVSMMATNDHPHDFVNHDVNRASRSKAKTRSSHCRGSISRSRSRASSSSSSDNDIVSPFASPTARSRALTMPLPFPNERRTTATSGGVLPGSSSSFQSHDLMTNANQSANLINEDEDVRLMPGKAFLKSFYAFLKKHRHSLHFRDDDDHDDFARTQVVLNPPCIHYMEHCFHAMLLPFRHDETGRLIQWETKKDNHAHRYFHSRTFSPSHTVAAAPDEDHDKDDDDECDPQLPEGEDVFDPAQSHMIAHAKAQKMLKLAGFILHLVDLSIQSPPRDAHSLPSQCQLSLFSSLRYLTVDSVPLATLLNLHSFRSQLRELHLKNIPDLHQVQVQRHLFGVLIEVVI